MVAASLEPGAASRRFRGWSPRHPSELVVSTLMEHAFLDGFRLIAYSPLKDSEHTLLRDSDNQGVCR
jgi:hypothetical protein